MAAVKTFGEKFALIMDALKIQAGLGWFTEMLDLADRIVRAIKGEWLNSPQSWVRYKNETVKVSPVTTSGALAVSHWALTSKPDHRYGKGETVNKPWTG